MVNSRNTQKIEDFLSNSSCLHDKLSSKKRSERRWNLQIQASQSGENHQGGQSKSKRGHPSCGTQLVSQFDDISHANIRDTRETQKALFMGLVIGKIEDCIGDRN